MPLVLIYSMQLFFAYQIMVDGDNRLPASVFTFCMLILLTAGYVFLIVDIKKINCESLYTLPALFFGSLSATYLNLNLGLGPVIGSALIGFSGAFVPKNFPRPEQGLQIRAAIYCGSFIGMSQPLTAHHYAFISFASLMGGVVFIASGGILNGFGGKLGSLAFAGVSLAIFILFLTDFLW